MKGRVLSRPGMKKCLGLSNGESKEDMSSGKASVRLGPKTLRTLDEEVKSLVSAWRLVMNSWKLGMQESLGCTGHKILSFGQRDFMRMLERILKVTKKSGNRERDVGCCL